MELKTFKTLNSYDLQSLSMPKLSISLYKLFKKMKRVNLTLAIIASLMLWASFSIAQVSYKIDYLTASEHYQLSLVVNQTWEAPYNLTGTGQITIKVPHGDFDVYDLRNLQEGVDWEFNSRFNAPEEASEYDYISFGLVTLGTKGLNYKAGTEIPLFTFKNNGTCQGEVALIDNENDPFLPPNSKQANIGNQLTVLGARGNAYVGNVEEGKATCATVSTTFSPEDISTSFEVYPNPTTEFLFLNFDWQMMTQSVQLNIYNILGEQIMVEKSDFEKGKNKIKLNVSNLNEGAYLIKIQGGNWEIALPKFTKIR